MTDHGSMDMKCERFQPITIDSSKSLRFSNSGSRDLPWIVCIRRLQKAGWQGAAGASQGKGIFPFQLAFESMKRFDEETRKKHKIIQNIAAIEEKFEEKKHDFVLSVRLL